MDLHDIRKDYRWGALLESNVESDPVLQFKRWFSDYTHMDTPDNTAVVVSTVDEFGKPHSRVVLLKGIEDNQFIFYTNYNSTKGRNLAHNPYISMVFFWPEMERQVRVEGIATKLSADRSDKYFNARPFENRVSAIISPQSQVVPNREYLENKMFAFLEAHPESDVLKRPDDWGGISVSPHLIEFWQGRPSRLHDRLRYILQEDGSWKLERLAP